MKKITILLVTIFFASSLLAQAPKSKIKNLRFHDKKPIHWGFTFGINTMDFTIHKNASFMSDSVSIYGIENGLQPGFHLGPILNLRLAHFFDFRMLINLSFGQRNLSYHTYSGVATDSATALSTTLMKIPSTFIEVPLLIKYKAVRLGNSRPYLIAGSNIRYDLNARKEPNDANGDMIQLQTLDFYFELGFGIDWYLPYFKLGTEFKFSNGFNNILKTDNSIYTSPIDKMTSKMFMISFHFEG